MTDHSVAAPYRRMKAVDLARIAIVQGPFIQDGNRFLFNDHRGFAPITIAALIEEGIACRVGRVIMLAGAQ